MAPFCDSKLTSPYTTAEICLTDTSTEYNDAECHCKPEKAVISEGTQVTPPELIQEVTWVIAPQPVEEPMQVVAQPAQAIPEPIEEPVPIAHPPFIKEAILATQPAERVIIVIPSACCRGDPGASPWAHWNTPDQFSEPFPEPSVILIDPEFPPYPADDISSVSSPFDIGSILKSLPEWAEWALRNSATGIFVKPLTPGQKVVVWEADNFATVANVLHKVH